MLHLSYFHVFLASILPQAYIFFSPRFTTSREQLNKNRDFFEK